MVQKKGSFELSSTILTVVIISVVVLALSITFLYRFTGGSEQASKEIDKTASAALSQPEGSKVTMKPNSAQLRPGDEQMVEITVLNVGNPESFFVQAELSSEEKNSIGTSDKKWLTYSQAPFPLENVGKHQEKMLIAIPKDAQKGEYQIKVKIFRKPDPGPDTQYGQTQTFHLGIIEEGKRQREEPLPKVPENGEKETCIKDFSCDYYIVFVPVDQWEAQQLFDVKVEERSLFFVDISPFKFKKTGIIGVPIDFAKDCGIKRIDIDSARDHMKIKSCADKYTDKLGIAYERAVGLSSEYKSGKAFFKSKSAYASLGFEGDDRPGLVAHEIGHTYSLCDEYDWQTYWVQNKYFGSNTCKNQWPEHCPSGSTECLGNTPTFRDYSGLPLFGACTKSTRYSVMGFSTGAECGYDENGYQAIEEGLR